MLYRSAICCAASSARLQQINLKTGQSETLTNAVVGIAKAQGRLYFLRGDSSPGRFVVDD